MSKDEEGVEGKSVVLVLNASLKAALTSSTKALGMRVVSHARILGVDACGAGAARQRGTQYARLTKIKKRMPQVLFYEKYGAIMSKIAKAGLRPSGLHGVRCMGMLPTRLKAFRTTVGRCLPGKHAGRSLTWRLATHECDPTHTCRVEPIVAWAEAVWDEQLDEADLHKAWRRQQRLVGLKPSWSKASGSTGAIIMCLRQLGWTWPHHTSLQMGTRWTCDRSVPGTSKRKRWWTVNWRFGKSVPATATSGRSSSRARCWNLWYWQTSEPTVDLKRRQPSRRLWA